MKLPHVSALFLLLVVVGQLFSPLPLEAQAPPRFSLADLEGYSPRFSPRVGDWLFFDLRPVTLKPTYKGKVRLASFTVVGDFSRIEWQTWPAAPVRTFDRVDRREVDGLVLSVFEPSFPAADLRFGPPLPIRFDKFHESGAWPFRIRSSALPKSRTVRINDRVQYSSHVVNIVVSSNWSSLAAPVPPGDRFANVEDAIQVFYEHFEDAYEDLAFIPTRAHRVPIGGRLSIVSEVEGIGLPIGNARELWGGGQNLMGLQIHIRGDFLWNGHTTHEMGHQWGFNLDLFEVAGVDPLDSTECKGDYRHPPLIAPLHSIMRDTCLSKKEGDPPLCIERAADGGWVLAHCEPPLAFHPFQLYAMGLLEPAEIPPLFLRQRQDRPQPYRAGTGVRGPFRKVTIDDVIAHYGARRGPRMSPIWRRAHIVLSPDRLLSRAELAWFNFYARRASDPDVTGIEALDYSPSLEFATRGKVDLLTAIRPLSGRRVEGNFEVSHPKLGKRDIAGVKLSRKLSTRFVAGRDSVLAGRVKSPGDHSSITVRIGSRTFVAPLDGNGRFEVAIELGPQDRGVQRMKLGLDDFEVLLAEIAPVYVE